MENQFRGVIPLLPVSDVAKTIAWYRDTLGHAVSQTGENWGSALRGKANFYFSRAEGAISPVSCFVYVDEVAALCAEFKAKGAVILEEPTNQPWGYRQFTLEDCNGHRFLYFRFADGVA